MIDAPSVAVPVHNISSKHSIVLLQANCGLWDVICLPMDMTLHIQDIPSC